MSEDYTSVTLTIPKFDFETDMKLPKDTLPEFGALFAEYGMAGALPESTREAGGNLSISRILHKTTFSCAEAGIEATAATVIEMTMGSARFNQKEVNITFDQPFYFTLTDRDGEVLFVGKVLVLPETGH